MPAPTHDKAMVALEVPAAADFFWKVSAPEILFVTYPQNPQLWRFAAPM